MSWDGISHTMDLAAPNMLSCEFGDSEIKDGSSVKKISLQTFIQLLFKLKSCSMETFLTGDTNEGRLKIWRNKMLWNITFLVHKILEFLAEITFKCGYNLILFQCHVLSPNLPKYLMFFEVWITIHSLTPTQSTWSI